MDRGACPLGREKILEAFLTGACLWAPSESPLPLGPSGSAWTHSGTVRPSAVLLPLRLGREGRVRPSLSFTFREWAPEAQREAELCPVPQ